MGRKNGSNEKMILAVSFDLKKNCYNIGSSKGVSINEMAFGVMTVIKSLVKGGHIADHTVFINKITEYCTDPQYEEVKNDNI